MRFKDEEIECYKDFKTKFSIKMVGKSLEQYCEIELNKLCAEGIEAEIDQYEECLNLKWFILARFKAGLNLLLIILLAS